MQKVYTITGKTDGFGAQYQAIMSGIAICKYKNYEYLQIRDRRTSIPS